MKFARLSDDWCSRSAQCSVLCALAGALAGCGDRVVHATLLTSANEAGGTSGASAGGAPNSAGASASANSGAGGGKASALPSHLLVGWGAEDYANSWAKNSGTSYDVQWTYLSGQAGNNWYNDFGTGNADGSLLDTVLSTVDGLGFIPGIHLYNLGYGHSGGDSGLVTELQDPAWTKEYFSEFKVMLQKIKNFGKPVIIVLEGDSFGYLETLTSNTPTASAAVASSGLPELADLPDTVAGFGMAYLALRKSVGVSNVLMGPDTPYYAAQGDIMNFPPSDTEDLTSHVAYQWSFFNALGVGSNMTGDRFDFSASTPRAADEGSETDGRDPWSASDTASVDSPSINRYVEWLRQYHEASGVPWVLHQVPIGNSQHANTPWSAKTPRSGYKDMLVEYLFQYESPASPALRSAHVASFANAGVICFLFGFSDDGDQPTNDLWLDNQPFFNTHVAAFLKAGGYAL